MGKYYQALGLSPGASEAEVKSAYRELIRRWHPDTKGGQDREATERTQALTEAYAMLKRAGLTK